MVEIAGLQEICDLLRVFTPKSVRLPDVLGDLECLELDGRPPWNIIYYETSAKKGLSHCVL